jgi:hypothetical protein
MADEKSDRIVLRNQQGTGRREDSEGACVVANEVKMEYDRVTDVMHVDAFFPPEGTRVDVLDVGHCLGFPGQIVARVSLEERVVYGVTIQNFTSFKRKLFWMYRMASIQRALQFMLNVLCAALWIDHDNHPAHLPA